MFINRIISHLAANRRRRQVSIELSSLSDHQLHDIGLSRFDLLRDKRQ